MFWRKDGLGYNHTNIRIMRMIRIATNTGIANIKFLIYTTNMKIKLPTKITQKKTPAKTMTESKFWQQIALEQQAILHAKYRT